VEKVLVAVDGSPAASVGLRKAGELACVLGSVSDSVVGHCSAAVLVVKQA
jgi:nucleotide-binding universal stress UspA family protein